MNNISSKEKIHFKFRFNTMHGNSDFFWRIIINDAEHLAKTIDCNVPTWSDASFDTKSNAIKYNIAGVCNDFTVDEAGNAFFK